MSGLRSKILNWGARFGLLQAMLATRRDQPLILMYHGVSAQNRFDGLRNAADLHLPKDCFAQHLRLLKRLRRVIGIGDMLNGLRQGEDLRNTVVLTFDDGYENNVTHAAPMLADHGMTASFFLATSFVGSDRWIWTDRVEQLFDCTQRAGLSWEGLNLPMGTLEERRQSLRQLKSRLKTLDVSSRDEQVAVIARELDVPTSVPTGDYRFMSWMQAKSLVSGGFEVGAHTRHHAILSRVSPEDAEAEIAGSRQDVITETGQCCPVFCYPNGKRSDFDSRTVEICQRHFEAAITTEHGHPDPAKLYELPRYSAGGDSAMLAATLFRAH